MLFITVSNFNTTRSGDSNLVREEIENCAQSAAVASEEFSIATALTDNSSILAALNVKNFAPESAGHPHFANFANIVRAF